MDRELVLEWVKALGSGEYAQGRNFLAVQKKWSTPDEPTRYCCLGVLCELAARRGIGTWELDEDGWWRSDGDTSLPGPEVMKAAGLVPGPTLRSFYEDTPRGVETFAHLNDELRASFEVIAQHVRKHILGEE